MLFLFTYIDSPTIHEAHSITRIIVYVSVKVNLLEFEFNLKKHFLFNIIVIIHKFILNTLLFLMRLPN